MRKSLSFVIIFFAAITVSFSLFAQESSNSTIEISSRFKSYFEKNEFKKILDEFENLKSENLLKNFSNDDKVSIHYIKFCSEIYLGINNDFDFSSSIELFTSLTALSNPNEQKNYLFAINNIIGDFHEPHPEWSIKLIQSIFNTVDFTKLPNGVEIEYSLLNIELNSYNRLEKFKESALIRTKLESMRNDNHSILRFLLEKANFNISISQFKVAYDILMSADSLMLNSNDGFSAKDSTEYFFLWGKFFKSINDTLRSKQYFQIAFEIAKPNNLIEYENLISYELALIESDLNLKIVLLENQLNNEESIDLPLKIAIINSLGVSYGKLNRFEKSLDCYLKIYNLENYFYEKVHLVTLLNLADINCKLEKYNEAEKFFNMAFLEEKSKLTSNLFFLTISERDSYWKKEKWICNEINKFSYCSYPSNKSSTELSFNSSIISKSLLLETTRELDRAISSSDNEEIKSQYNEMKQLRRIVSKMQSEGLNKKELMDRYIAQADSVDKKLMNQLGEYAAAKRKLEITWKDVQNSLSPSEAAIEFASYYDNKDSTKKYLALLVRPGYEYPNLIKMGSEAIIKETIQMKDYSTLYNLVWQGLDSLLKGVNKVYYSPDGELNNISFSGLYHRKNGSDSIFYLIDRYDLHQVTTTRHLADGTLKIEQPFESSAVLLGGIDYNQIPSVSALSKGKGSNEDYLFQLNLDQEVKKNRSSSFSSKMPLLQGTEMEVKNISGILNQNGWKATTYTGQSAGENQIKYDLLQKSPGVLHIATHGFAFPDIVKKESDLLQMNETSTYKASEDPMVRCGLMLSGSNISWSGEPKKMIEQTGDDGVLTAAEVANMDLLKIKLVVLSACETGLGKIEGSEGTFGLKRAFKLAGVEQLIVSLWSVPDKETMELMTLFYTDLSLTKDPAISFQKAQREMRFRYPFEPEKWAGFVLVR